MRLKTFKLHLDDGLARESVGGAGHYLRVTNASSFRASIIVYTEKNEVSGFPMTRGSGWKHLAFDSLIVDAAAQPGEWVEITVAGNPDEARQELFDTYTPDVESEQPILVGNSNEFIQLSFATTSVTFVDFYTVPVGRTLHVRGMALYRLNSTSVRTIVQVRESVGGSQIGIWETYDYRGSATPLDPFVVNENGVFALRSSIAANTVQCWADAYLTTN